MDNLKYNEIIEQIEKTVEYEGHEFTIILYKIRNIKERMIEYCITYKNYGQMDYYIGIYEKDITKEIDENNKYNAFMCAYENYIENEF